MQMRFYIDYPLGHTLGTLTYCVCDANEWGRLVAEFDREDDADEYCLIMNSKECLCPTDAASS